MLKSLVFKQKQEKERLLSLSYIERTKEKEARKWLNSDLIKVVLGPRRAGKSVFSLMLLKDRDFAYFNFDDESLPGNNQLNLEDLMKELKQAYGDTKYVLFDEIQNLPKWELFVSRLHREGYNLVITGSNARLLSKELATALTGRHIPIEILPFDFHEILKAKGLSSASDTGSLLQALGQYMISGGYPEVVLKDVDLRGYLDVLLDSLLFKDVVKRHRVRYTEQIDALSTYLVNNFTSQYSIRKLTGAIGAKSGVTIEKYLAYLIEAYVVFVLNRYSVKVGMRLRAPKKVYLVDNGFVAAKAVQYSPNNGKLMENLVFIELVKKGNEPNRELFYYRTRNDKEVDFLVKRGNEVVELVQVCYEIGNREVEQREVKALLEAREELSVQKLTIVTWEDRRHIQKDDAVIHCVPLYEWLLNLHTTQ